MLRRNWMNELALISLASAKNHVDPGIVETHGFELLASVNAPDDTGF